MTYTADWKNGYNANVQYEGEALHPKELIKASGAGGAGSHGWASSLSSSSGSALEAAADFGGSSYSTGGSDHSGGSSSKWTPTHP